MFVKSSSEQLKLGVHLQNGAATVEQGKIKNNARIEICMQDVVWTAWCKQNFLQLYIYARSDCEKHGTNTV